ncbi:type II toxin-antitoxin system Phd/YefM family antitoxin [Rhizobium mesosinicum]|uniref:Prevent-host-death family protein n=1 Tax=Rhizobium mesosinicum TaxID=335017 RepID=A0ABS7GXS9_9HYPH|nr:prevent-host-death family protein [Rhizobium mesosinicum]MBW9054617.1 prevent-host-death family protein [Rhizobium mesosinicum]
MRVVIDADEAAERLEELLDLIVPEDEVIICRDGIAVAILTAITKGEKQTSRGERQSLAGNPLSGAGNASAIDAFLKLAAEGRAAVDPNTTSAHDDFYDEHGLPK